MKFPRSDDFGVPTRKPTVRWNLVLAVTYFIIFAFSVVYAYIMAPVTAFCGLYAIVLTLPWSLIATGFFSAVCPDAFNSMIPGAVIILLSGIINTSLILFAPSLMARRARRS